MNLSKKLLFTLLLTGLLTSCTTVSTDQISQNTTTDTSTSRTTSSVITDTTSKTTTTEAPPPQINECELLFANREKTPTIVEKTIGNVQYTVTLNSNEYYLGDDIDISVIVKNVATEAITLKNDSIHELNHAIWAAVYLDGVKVKDQIMQLPTTITGELWEYTWEVGSTLSNIGRYSTSLNEEILKTAEKISIVISFLGEESRLEIPLTLHMDIPQDTEMFPYLEQGMISEGLYRRVCVMNMSEKIHVLIPLGNGSTWNEEMLSSESIAQFSKEYVYGGCMIALTREQLLTFLAEHTQKSADSQTALKYFYEQWGAIRVHNGYILNETFDLTK